MVNICKFISAFVSVMYHGDEVQKFELCCGYSVRVLNHVN
jgi:hypothetical protein